MKHLVELLLLSDLIDNFRQLTSISVQIFWVNETLADIIADLYGAYNILSFYVELTLNYIFNLYCKS